jgi:indole-3-glycerol phosphate synthase
MTPSVLHQIAESVRKRLGERKAQISEQEVERLCKTARTPYPFQETFRQPGIHVIAEVKFASPSQGTISQVKEPNPVEVASSYLQAGARALSVLTEQDHFHGKPEYLSEIRKAHPEARLLLKDFVLERYQLLEARVLGADAALLIVALLGKGLTAELLSVCREIGLSALVEVHDEDELNIAVEAGAELIGINNRNLKTLAISLDTSYRLKNLAPKNACLISESGIHTAQEIRSLRSMGFSGFLIGTSLMKTGSPGDALKRLLWEAQ